MVVAIGYVRNARAGVPDGSTSESARPDIRWMWYRHAFRACTIRLVMDDDPYLWLEDVEGEAALEWVAERNSETEAVLAMRQPASLR